MDPLTEIFGVPAPELFRKKELFVTHGPLERFPAFMRQGPMESIDALTRHYTGPLEVSQGTAEGGVQFQVSGAHATALLELGVTVFFSDMHRALPEAPKFLRALEGALGLAECSTLSAFVNAPGSGLSVHHDRFDQLFFQIRGNKEFRFAPNGFVENPDVSFSPYGAAAADWGQTYRHGFPLTSDELFARGLESVTLQPGSAFFMPAGTWHTTAEQREHALSLVVAVRAPSRLEVLLNFVRHYASQASEWRARPYGGFGGDKSTTQAEHETMTRLAGELGRRLEALPVRDAFDAYSAHGFCVGTQAEYPRHARFERYIRLPNSSVVFENDATPGKFRCIVSSGPTHRPQARTVMAFNADVRPVIEWVLVERKAFTVTEAATRFPAFSHADLLELFGWLSHAALVRPIPVPEWTP